MRNFDEILENSCKSSRENSDKILFRSIVCDFFFRIDFRIDIRILVEIPVGIPFEILVGIPVGIQV